jgi:outer membrane cobalamin receptor
MLRVLTFLVSVFLATAAGARVGSPLLPADPLQTTPVATFRTKLIVTAERGPEDRDRLPVATSVLHRQELQSRPAPTLAQAIHSLPGVHLVSEGTSGLPSASSARGFFGGEQAEYLTVLVYAVSLGDVESGVVRRDGSRQLSGAGGE